MGGGQQHGAVKAHLGPDLRRQAAQRGAGHADGLEDLPGQAQGGNQPVVPVPGPGVDQGGGGGVGVLVGSDAGEQIVQVIRHHQEGLGRGQLVGMLPLKGGELIGGVEGLVLDAGAGIMVGKGQHRCQPVPLALGAAVPVGHRVADDLARAVQQHKVHCPGVNAHRGGDKTRVLAGLQAGNDIVPQAVHLPAKVTVFLHQAVFKPVNLFQLHAAVLDPAQNVPAGGCPDVNGKMIRQCLRLSFLVLFTDFSIPERRRKNKRVIYNKITRLFK